MRVAAASVDSVDKTVDLRKSLRIGFPMYGDLDGAQVAEDVGAYLETGERTFLDATGFLLNPDAQIVNSLYSSGPIGRLTASDVLRKTLFELQK